MTGLQENGDGDRLEFSYPDIPKGRVNTVEWDGERLWVGTYHGAASLIRSPSGWKVESIYNSSNGLCSDSVNVIKSTGHSLWFASYLDHKNGGISIWDNDGTHFITVADGLPMHMLPRCNISEMKKCWLEPDTWMMVDWHLSKR